MAQGDDDGLEIQFLMTGPADEANLGEVFGGYTFQNSTDLQRNFWQRHGDGESTVQNMVTGHQQITEDYLEPSMLGCFLAPWRCGQRGTRMRGRSWKVEVRQLLDPQCSPCTSGDGKCRTRKNNEHWTEDEMVKLVEGVSKKGIGKWSKIKGEYFPTSIRTAVHIKDKWRNLVRACKAKTTSKRKVNVQKATELIVRRFKHRILAIESKGLVKKKK